MKRTDVEVFAIIWMGLTVLLICICVLAIHRQNERITDLECDLAAHMRRTTNVC